MIRTDFFSGFRTLDYTSFRGAKLDPIPPDIQILNCSHSEFLTELPDLPDSLELLYCYNCKLKSLPKLPPNLKSIWCWDNELTELPALPNSLTYINCMGNKITHLPDLPESIEVLNCTDNRLSEMPALDQLQSLGALICDRNQLKELPDLPPNVKYVSCKENKLLTVPFLPKSLKSFYVNGNPFESPYSEIIGDGSFNTKEEVAVLRDALLRIKGREMQGLLELKRSFQQVPNVLFSNIGSRLTRFPRHLSVENQNTQIRRLAGQPPRTPLPPPRTPAVVEEVGPEVTGATCTGAGCFRLPRFFTRRRATVTPALRRNRRTQRKRNRKKING